jgi:ubiquinone/menaquinone biosynthesis C-methylase UbiE
MRLITFDDIIETYTKLRQRGSGFIMNKFSASGTQRTLGAFAPSAVNSANWWIIPRVLERWNELQTGDPHTNYKQYLMQKYYSDKRNLALVSLGSGNCQHELELARYEQFSEIRCYDLAQNRLDEAKAIADAEGLRNIKFRCEDVNTLGLQKESLDLVHFNSSLHHFQNVENLLANVIKPALKPGGMLLINEFVGPNRIQYSKEQTQAISEALQLIDKEYRTRFRTNVTKIKFYGSGRIRMIIADPSECVDSENIMQSIHKHFRTIEEKPYGGNILMGVLKDISHHFVELDLRKTDILQALFDYEDRYISDKTSDFVFGIYSK